MRSVRSRRLDGVVAVVLLAFLAACAAQPSADIAAGAKSRTAVAGWPTPPKAQRFDASGMKLPPSELDCLREAIYFEAGPAARRGGVAVASVILNRVESEAFPNSVCAVIAQGENDRGACQFSYRCDGRPEDIADPAALEAVDEVARRALAARPDDPTHGALFFHAKGSGNSWFRSLERVAEVEGNVFYRPSGG